MLYIAISAYRPSQELIIKLNTLRTYITISLADKEDISKARTVIYKHATECIRLTNYTLCIIKDNCTVHSRINGARIVLESFLDKVMRCETIADIKTEFESISNTVSNTISECYNLYSYELSDAASELRFENTDIYKMHPDFITEITDNIKTNKPLNIFSIECGEGQDEYFLKDKLARTNNTSVKTYGLSMEIYGSNKAKENMDRVALGSIKGSTISNNVFDIVYVNPRITINTTKKVDGRLMITNEDIQITNSIRYLKPGGVFILNLPFYDISPNFRLFLAKNLKDIQIFKCTDPLLDSYIDTCRDTLKYVTIIGTKQLNTSYSDEFNRLSRIKYEDLKDYLDYSYTINLPDEEIKIFRGSILDKSELDEVILTDGLYEDFYKTINEHIEEEDKSPLLPFNIGQIGLILSSGSLDGVVEEGNGVCHVIKGMTIKETDTVTEQSTENGRIMTQSTDTVRNKVQITALGADGTFYNLT